MRSMKLTALCLFQFVALAIGGISMAAEPQQGGVGASPAPQGTPQQTGSVAPQQAPGAAQQAQSSDAKVLTIDLANAPAEKYVAAGSYTLKFINKLPSFYYRTRTWIQSDDIPQPFDLAAFKGSTANPPPSPTAGGQANAATGDESRKLSCQTASTRLLKELEDYKSEADVSLLRTTYAIKLRETSDGSMCTDQEVQDLGAKLTALTEWSDDSPLPELASGDILTIHINRQSSPSSGNEKEATARSFGTWKFRVGRPAAQWLTYYGFNFAKSGDRDYFSKTNANSSPVDYTITRKGSTKGSAFSPSIYVLHMPARGGGFAGWRTENMMGGVTAGLGFDFDNPTVFLGYGVGWGYNVMLTGGVVMHKEHRLNGQYKEGDVVGENLTNEQLTESTYKPRVFVGLALRFGSNPFASGTSTTSTGTSPGGNTKQNTK